jgi:hypothetical protein
MMRGQIPPQGYAKESLIQAFDWLQAQPENVKSQAVSADALIALFNRAKRNGEGTVRVSSEQFKTELKDIATELKNFSDPEPPPPKEKPAPRQLPLDMQKPASHRDDLRREDVVRDEYRREDYRRMAPPPREDLFHGDLDPRTSEMLQKVRHHLNLGSDSEALRMLVVLGFERLQNLFR